MSALTVCLFCFHFGVCVCLFWGWYIRALLKKKKKKRCMERDLQKSLGLLKTLIVRTDTIFYQSSMLWCTIYLDVRKRDSFQIDHFYCWVLCRKGGSAQIFILLILWHFNLLKIFAIYVGPVNLSMTYSFKNTQNEWNVLTKHTARIWKSFSMFH